MIHKVKDYTLDVLRILVFTVIRNNIIRERGIEIVL